MKVIYDSDNYCVVEYAAQHGFEVVDKQTQRCAFFQGYVAERFAQSMRDVCAEENVTIARLDEFLDDFDVQLSQPVLYN